MLEQLSWFIDRSVLCVILDIFLKKD